MMRLHAWLGTTLVALAACSAPGASPPAAATAAQPAPRGDLDARLRQCTQRHGFDPDAAQDAPQRALAPGELQWRQCAYDAIRVRSQQLPALAPRYEQLIAEDIMMTTAIQQGTMTRAQRRARIEALAEQIRSAEEAAARSEAARSSRAERTLRGTLENLRSFESLRSVESLRRFGH